MLVQGLVQIGDRFLISPYEDEIMCMMIMKKNSKSHDSLKRYLMILVLHSKMGALKCRFAGKMDPPPQESFSVYGLNTTILQRKIQILY